MNESNIADKEMRSNTITIAITTFMVNRWLKPTLDVPSGEPHIAFMEKIEKTDAEWRAQLNPVQYHVLREAGTERAYAGTLTDEKRAGQFFCAGCGSELFASDTKFDSGSGWPSFTAPADGGAVHEESDTTHGMVRTEVRCARCDGHLGHVFPDGPGPVGLRYCINSAALEFQPE